VAVDRAVAGRGLGGILIADALLRTKRAAEHVAMVAPAVDPIDDAVRAFRSAYGFVPLQGGERRMFLAVEKNQAYPPRWACMYFCKMALMRDCQPLPVARK